MSSKIHGKSFQVGPGWPQVGPSWAKLACQMEALMKRFTRCSFHPLFERNMAQHSANMGRKPFQNGSPKGGSELWFFNLVSFLSGSWRQDGRRCGQDGFRWLQECIWWGFWIVFGWILCECWVDFVWMLFCFWRFVCTVFPGAEVEVSMTFYDNFNDGILNTLTKKTEKIIWWRTIHGGAKIAKDRTNRKDWPQ